MLLQFSEILSYTLVYLPVAIYTGFDAALLIIGYLIRKKNKYTYGLYFMISATFSLLSSIIFFSLNYPFLPYTLLVPLNLSIEVMSAILTITNITFSSFGIASAIFLFIGLYYVYHTHKSTRADPNPVLN